MDSTAAEEYVLRPVVVNPQNALEDFDARIIQEAVESQGMQRIDGVLVPAVIAQAKAKRLSNTAKKCPLCARGGSIRPSRTSEGLLQVTMCEVQQHNTLVDCWIVCGKNVYDASAFLREDTHPGGERAFLRRAGGIVDCSEDFVFHSAKGRRLWGKYLIATVVECDERGEGRSSGHGCIIS